MFLPARPEIGRRVLPRYTKGSQYRANFSISPNQNTGTDTPERANTRLAWSTGRFRWVADTTPRDLTTPESYLGYRRLARYAGSPIVRDRPAAYRLPKALPQNELAYGGTWTVRTERIVAGPGATLQLHFHAEKIYLVLGGRGRVQVSIAGKEKPSVKVDSYRLYTLRDSTSLADALLTLRFTAGVEAYAFTFG